jgi:hypothetical protein
MMYMQLNAAARCLFIFEVLWLSLVVLGGACVPAAAATRGESLVVSNGIFY